MLGSYECSTDIYLVSSTHTLTLLGLLFQTVHFYSESPSLVEESGGEHSGFSMLQPPLQCARVQPMQHIAYLEMPSVVLTELYQRTWLDLLRASAMLCGGKGLLIWR